MSAQSPRESGQRKADPPLIGGDLQRDAVRGVDQQA